MKKKKKEDEKSELKSFVISFVCSFLRIERTREKLKCAYIDNFF